MKEKQLHIRIPDDRLEEAQADARYLGVPLTTYVLSLLESGHRQIEAVKRANAQLAQKGEKHE